MENKKHEELLKKFNEELIRQEEAKKKAKAFVITDGVYPTWEELLNMKPGTILRDWMDGEIRCVILRSSASLCAYLGVEKNHRLANQNYDDVEIECHGGLTFCGEGGEGFLPEGYFWYGWDYAHAYDYPFYNDQFPLNSMYDNDPEMKAYREKQKRTDRKWLVEHVEKDMVDSIASFQRLKYRSERWWLRIIDRTNDWVLSKTNFIRSWWWRIKWKWKNAKVEKIEKNTHAPFSDGHISRSFNNDLTRLSNFFIRIKSIF